MFYSKDDKIKAINDYTNKRFPVKKIQSWYRHKILPTFLRKLMRCTDYNLCINCLYQEKSKTMLYLYKQTVS